MNKKEKQLLETIKKEDKNSTNGGHYVQSEKRDTAEKLVDKGKLVRLQNPAGLSPIYVPLNSNHYSKERLEKLKEEQSKQN